MAFTNPYARNDWTHRPRSQVSACARERSAYRRHGLRGRTDVRINTGASASACCTETSACRNGARTQANERRRWPAVVERLTRLGGDAAISKDPRSHCRQACSSRLSSRAASAIRRRSTTLSKRCGRRSRSGTRQRPRRSRRGRLRPTQRDRRQDRHAGPRVLFNHHGRQEDGEGPEYARDCRRHSARRHQERPHDLHRHPRPGRAARSVLNAAEANRREARRSRDRTDT